MDEPLDAIIDIIRKELGIAPAKLLPAMRIYHDLRIDGDDAYVLLLHIQERFGTDFSALDWHEFFNSEGVSLRFCLILSVATVGPGALTLCLATVVRLPDWMSWGVYITVFLIIVFSAKRLFPEKPKRPVTIAGLAEMVRSGTWPKDPANVG